MITTAQTLVGLACLISNKGEIDTSGIEAQLTDIEKVQIESVIESGACLPENLERLLQKTKQQELEQRFQHQSPAPSEACFA